MVAYVLMALSLVCTTGCAKETSGPADPTNADFHAIMVQEHRIAESTAVVRAELERTHPDCERVCSRSRRICEAAEAVCETASQIDDVDARTRCQRARAGCREERARAAERCACPGRAAP